MPFSPTKPREYGSTKGIVAQLISEAGGVKRAAFLAGRAESQVYAYADPAVDAQMSLDCALRLSVACGSVAIAQHAASVCGGVYMPISPSADPLHDLSAKSAKEHGALMGALIEALQDGKLSPTEANKLIASIDLSLRALVSIRAKLVASKG
jgi:hypothetical protein